MRALRIFSPISIFVLFILFPLIALFSRSGSFTSLEISPLLSPVFFFTLKQALASVLASLVLGLFFSFFVKRSTPLLEGLLLGVFSLPSLGVVGLFLILVRKFGLDFGLPLLIAAHAYLNAPWIALAVFDARATFPEAWRKGARSLGATPRQVFLRFELPWFASRLGVAAAQVFAFCVMSFTLVLLLGGGPPVSTLETEIYAAVRGGGMNLGYAAQFALAQLLLAVFPLALSWKLRIRNASAIDSLQGEVVSGNVAQSATSGKSFSLSDRVALLVAIFWLALPLMALGAGLADIPEAFHSLFTREFLSAFGLSFWVASLSAVLGLVFAVLFASSVGEGKWQAFIRALASVPIGVSPLTLSLGVLLAYSLSVSLFDPFDGSITAIVCIHAVLLLPFGLRFISPVIEEGQTSHRIAQRFSARSLGASAWESFWATEWPYYRKGVTDFLRVAWIWSFADLAVVSFFGSERLVTLPVLIARQMGHYEFDAAAATLFFITLLSLFVLFLGRARSSALGRGR